MAYCVPLGIPHSEFLSWSEEDQDKALAYQRAMRELCSCGTREAEWEEDKFAYVSDHRQCPGCELIEMEKDNLPDGGKGYHIFLTRNERSKKRGKK